MLESSTFSYFFQFSDSFLPRTKDYWRSTRLCRVYSLCDAMRRGKDPLRSYERTTAQILVEGIYQGDLPAPLVRVRVFASYHACYSVGTSCLNRTTRGSLHTTNVFTVYRTSGGSGNRCRFICTRLPVNTFNTSRM